MSYWAWDQLQILDSKGISPSKSIGSPDTVVKIHGLRLGTSILVSRTLFFQLGRVLCAVLSFY